jgi:hypothetical protein
MRNDQDMIDNENQRPAVWIGHVAMHSGKVAESSEFMLSIGMRHIFSDEGIAVLEMRGGTHLVITSNPDSGLVMSSFDLMVDDIDASHREFTDLGLKPTDIERGNIHDEFMMTEPGGTAIRFNSSHASDLPV